jgi:hypothetical protein
MREVIILCCMLGMGVTGASAQTPLSSTSPSGTLPSASAESSSVMTAPAEAAEQAAPAGPAEAGPVDTAPSDADRRPSTAAKPTGLNQKSERFGGVPEAESTPRSRPRLRIGKAISVTTTRIGGNDTSDDGHEDSAPPAKCDLQSDVHILHDKPTGKTREVATLQVDGASAQHEDILSLLKRKACEAGADAVLITRMGQTSVEGVKVDHVEAVALIVGTPKLPVDPAPVPKSITVTPDGPAVPKTITVDPGASP